LTTGAVQGAAWEVAGHSAQRASVARTARRGLTTRDDGAQSGTSHQRGVIARTRG
jgi:hypothetical protein